MQEIGIDPGPILIEPLAKNTAAAIIAACLFAHSKDEESILLVAPSDHVIPDKRDFHRAVKIGLSHIQNNKLSHLESPTNPETGYGYLELSKKALDQHGTSDVIKFVEKPASDHASQMVADDNYLWNAGIFLFRTQDMIEAFATAAPKTLDLVSKSITGASIDLGFLRLAEEPWSMLDDISIDYAIMELAQNLVAVPYMSKWSDLGDWNAVWSEGQQDKFGNVLSETAHALDCSNSLLRSESSSQQIVGIGLDDIMVIAMPELSLAQKKSADVKKAVAILKKNSIPQAEIYPKTIVHGAGLKVWQWAISFK